MSDEGPPREDEGTEAGAADALKGRVAGEAPPPESVSVLTPEEAARYTSHPKAKPPEGAAPAQTGSKP